MNRIRHVKVGGISLRNAMLENLLRKQHAINGWLRQYHAWILLLVWLAVQVGCWRYYKGPHLMGDGVNYMGYARQLLTTGTLPAAYGQLYIGYSAFIGFFLLFKLDIQVVCLSQVIISGLAAVALYHTARRLAGGRWAPAAIAALIFIVWIEVQQFNAFILTESLFTSFLVFSLWAIARAQTKLDVLLALLLMLYTATLRPNGFIALGAAGLTGCWLLWQRRSYRWSVLGGLLLLGSGGLVLNKVVDPFFLLPSYAAGEILFDYPSVTASPPADLIMPSATGLPLARLGWFILHNPGYFSKLCAWKALYFLGLPRPWYSPLHKIWIVLVLLPIYASAMLSFRRQEAISTVQIYLAATILLQLIIIMLTTEDQNARFSAPLITYWVQLAVLRCSTLTGLGRFIRNANATNLGIYF